MPADLAEFVLAKLKATSAVTDLIFDGVDGISEPGQPIKGKFAVDYLADAEQRRREAGTPAQLLAILVQDAGEKAENEMRHTPRVAIYLYDRGQGRANIRAIRKFIDDALHGQTTPLDDSPTSRQWVRLEFDERTGHSYDYVLVLDYEKLVYRGWKLIDHG